MNLVALAENRYVRAVGVFLGITAAAVTLYHMRHQIRLTKLNLARAEREAKHLGVAV